MIGSDTHNIPKHVRRAKRSTAFSLTALLTISLSFTGMGAVFAQDGATDPTIMDVAAQPAVPADGPAVPADGTDVPADGTDVSPTQDSAVPADVPAPSITENPDSPPTQEETLSVLRAAPPAEVQSGPISQAAAPNPPTVNVTKTLVAPGPFSPDQQFTYRIQYACSSLVADCLNVVLTDTIPDELAFVTNAATADPSTITYTGATKLLKVVFTKPVGPNGEPGLTAGTTGQLLVTVKFPAGTPSGTTATNCANIAAAGATPAQSCVGAASLTTPAYSISLDKSYSVPATGSTPTSGVQGTGATTTLDLSTTIGGNQPASSVTVVDPDPTLVINNNPFESFDLIGFVNPVLPVGVQGQIQVKSSTSAYQTVGTFTNGQTVILPGSSGIAAADVTGIQIVYTRTDGQPIAAGTTLGIKAGVQLRNTSRSAPSADVVPGTVPNRAAVTATYPDAPNQAATDTADYTVIAQSPSTQATKTITPSSAQQNSGADVTMTIAGKNSGNLTANSMTVTDPDPASTATPFTTFTFKNFTPLATMPTGVTANVDVLVGGVWTRVGTGLANGAIPSIGIIPPADVQGVRYTYNGTINPGVTITNSFVTTLKDTVAAGTLNKVNCASVSLTTVFGGGAVQDGVCANFTVTSISKSVTSAKTFNPTSGTAQTGASTTVTLGGTNTSNVPVTNFVVVDPGTGSDATFNFFNFTGFGPITAPAGTTWTVRVFNGTSWVAAPGTYSTTQTPELPGSVSPGQVQGVEYTLASGTMAASTSPSNTRTFSTTNTLQLRDTTRSGGTSIASGSVKNCLTVSSTGATDSTTCATFTINAIDPGTGTGASKDIAASSVIQDTGATTNVRLNGRNDSNTPVSSIVIEDKDGIQAGTFFGSFTFNGFGTTTRPTGTTSLMVEYLQADLTTWAPSGSYPGTGDVTPALPNNVTNAEVRGVRYTWTGTFAPAIAVRANFNAKLKDGAAAASVRNCLQAIYDGSLIDPVTRIVCDSVTITPQTRTVDEVKSFSPATGTLVLVPAATTTATLTVKNTSNVGIDSIVVTDPDGTTTPFEQFNLTGFTTATMPSNVRLKVEVSTDAGANWTTVAPEVANTGTIPTPANAADVTAVRLTYTATPGNKIPANSTAMSVGLQLVLRTEVRGTDTAVGTTTIRNCFDTVATTGSFTFTGDPCANFTPQAQSPGVSAGKTWIPASGVRDTLPSSIITIKGRNSGNVPVDSMVLQDPATVVTPVALATNAFDAFSVTGFSGLVLPQGANQVKIDVLTADGTWHNGTPAATLPAGPTINTVALADIVGVRATFSNSAGTKLPVVTDPTKTGDVGINVTLRSTLRSTGGQISVPPAGSVVVGNQSNAIVVVNGTPSNPATADAKYTITSGTVKVAPDKTLFPEGSPTDVNPNQSLIYQLQIKNTGDRNLVAPVVLDKFDPAQLGYDATQLFPAGSYQFVANGSSLTGTGLVVDHTSVPGQVKFNFASGDFLAPGQTAYIRVVLTTRPGLASGTVVTNTYGITYDVTANGTVQCPPGSSSFVDGNATYCADSIAVKIIKSESMASIKQIRGDGTPFTNIPNPGNPCPDVAGFTYYPCIAHTHVNGIFDYRLEVSNSGNVPIGRARAIDVLPHVGDTGVLLTGQSRGSQWTPSLFSTVTVSGLPAGATATLYYSNTYTPSTSALSNNGGAWGGDWSTTPGADTKSIGIDVVTTANTPIPPAGSFTLNWKMKAPPQAPGVGSIAWNSFAFTGEPIGGSGWLLAAEPRKVGIDLVNPSVQVQKATTPEGSNGTFSFTLTPVVPAVGGGTEPVTTAGGNGSTTPWTNLTPGGTYQLSESATAGDAPTFVAGKFSCRNGGTVLATKTLTTGGVEFIAPANAVIVCSITNTKRPEISVSKTAVGGNGTFSFTLTGAGGSVKQVSVIDGLGTATWGPEGLQPGEYTLTEDTTTTGDGWVAEFNSCTSLRPSDGESDGESEGLSRDLLEGEAQVGTALTDGRAGVTLELAAGDVISCDFTNTKRPEISIEKTAVGGQGTFDFTLTGDGGSTVPVTTTGGAGSFTWGPAGLTPGGTYTLAETIQPGWVSTFNACTGVQVTSSTSSTVTFTATPGAVISCGFTNTKRPDISVQKTAVGGNGTFSFTLAPVAPAAGGSTGSVTTTGGAGSFTWGPAGLTPGGTYTLTETVQTGWVSTFSACTGVTPTSSTASSVTFTAVAGATISCGFTNTRIEEESASPILPSGPATPAAPSSPPSTAIPAIPPSVPLPATGSNIDSVIAIAMSLLMAGFALVLMTVKRRRALN